MHTAQAYGITFINVTTSAHMPATHNTPYDDAYREAGECIINPTPGFESCPPAQPVDVTSLTMLNHTEDDKLLDRRGGKHCESSEEDSGFEDGSGDDTSDGRVSPETSDCRQGGPLWRGQQGRSGQKEKTSRGSLQQTLEEEMRTWCQQTPLWTL